MEKKIMLSAIQPTSVFTLGNYIGAIKNWKENQEKFNCIFFIANLHALTVKQNPKEFKQITLNCLSLLLACGINPLKSLIFIQSQVKQHPQLSWILQCFTQFGELSRMTQFKDKSQKNPENVNAGLFGYPVLMAADILLYEPDLVPIGIDQKQHMEITKTIAKRFNNIYGEIFKIPESYFSEVGSKIKSLANPSMKMSKSDKNKNGTIYLLDDEKTVLEKIKKATTDSDNKIKFDPENKPGISNLMEIYTNFTGCTIEQTQNLFKNTNYGTFKLEVAKTISKELEPIQNSYRRILSEPEKLKNIYEEGAKKATKIASKKLEEIYTIMGLL